MLGPCRWRRGGLAWSPATSGTVEGTKEWPDLREKLESGSQGPGIQKGCLPAFLLVEMVFPFQISVLNHLKQAP